MPSLRASESQWKVPKDVDLGTLAEHWLQAGREGTQAALPLPKPSSPLHSPFHGLLYTQTATACAWLLMVLINGKQKNGCVSVPPP